ncbi:Hop1p Ecym_8026 [Eremothecium cymbalariae DBVPG|uniref:HORMA domain-containing protein n=1 Tax=Eremothecium cymbalariae (strain CBS 270.75 / DBVPG 7215 / KCTC 17166 / NRRL Y-17582) TaxID=931890 RepID=G8JWU8_ERECY|nr:Hypothetical protein Ecym_8026 [Eremothecium cymbalariae DBVPG\
MSTVQQIKQITKTRTVISTEQSQKLIQTMLTMSFGCLAFLRGLFPDESFVDQKFVPEKCNKTYDKANAPSIKIKTLVRGKSEEADLFLDWLEKGVFIAVKMRYLKAICLGIFTDRKNPNDLLESYVFSIDYPTATSVTLRINDQEESISLLDSRKMMQQLMRRFIIITQSLDPLPRERYLTMRLLFNDTTPAEYQPRFFKEASLDPKPTIKIPDSTDMDTVSVGVLNTHHHKLGIKVLSLVDMDIQERENPNTKTVDPFELLNQPIELKVDSLGSVRFNSQTTNMLQNYLNSSPGNICPTQALYTDNKDNKLACECGMPCSVASFTKRCSSCKREVHGLCYGNNKTPNIEHCISCLMEEKPNFDLESREFKTLMVLRRLYRYLKTTPNLGMSDHSLQQNLFDGDTSQATTTLLNQALSILIQDDIILVDEDRKTNSKGEFIKESAFIDIQNEGIVLSSGPLNPGRYVFTIVMSSKNAQKCYTEPVPTSAEQVYAWTSAIRRSLNHLNRNKRHSGTLHSSINFSSLAIDDTLDPIPTMKRKNIHISDNSHNDTINEIPHKVRKISVSKKTLKSAW